MTDDRSSPDRLAYTHIVARWHDDLSTHRARARDLGVDCPDDVFEPLFHAPRLDPTHLLVVGAVDWRGVRWSEVLLSARALSEVHAHRVLEPAIDAARIAAAETGVSDDSSTWLSAATWPRPPVLIDGEVSAARVSYELVVGATRLGTLLGLLDRGDVTPEARHRVWVGRRR